MFLAFFYALRHSGLPVSLHEYLTLLDGLRKGLVQSIDDFYALGKTVLVKDESQLDRYDIVFGRYFQGMEELADEIFAAEIPEEWLRKTFERELTEAEREAIERLGGLDALLERFQELLDEQKEAHRGGNKWIGTGGTSPFGHGGYHPEGFRIGGEGRNRRAIKVWQRRDFQNLDDRVELNTRNMKLIFKRLRILSRTGLPSELDLDGTIRKTSDNGGMLDIAMQAPRKNQVKVLMLMDVGGSMDEHVSLCEQLFSAARWEFKHLEFYYFHNCVYESVWKDNKRRFRERIPTLELIHKFNKDYKMIFVGDAAMSPYEIHFRGGSVEHYNDEPGITWLRRLKEQFPDMVWINPTPEYEWDYYESTQMIRSFSENRMFPMTMDGLLQAMRCLNNSKHTYTNQIWGEQS